MKDLNVPVLTLYVVALNLLISIVLVMLLLAHMLWG